VRSHFQAYRPTISMLLKNLARLCQARSKATRGSCHHGSLLPEDVPVPIQLNLRFCQWNLQHALELLSPIYGHSGVHFPLSIEECSPCACFWVRIDSIVPYSGMNVNAASTRHIVCTEVLRLDIITFWRSQVCDKGLPILWVKQLTTIRVIVTVPQRNVRGRAGWRHTRATFFTKLWLFSIPQQVMVRSSCDGVVFPIKEIAIPVNVELPLCRACFIASARVELSPTLRWPCDNFKAFVSDREVLRVLHDMAQTSQVVVSREFHWHMECGKTFAHFRIGMLLLGEPHR